MPLCSAKTRLLSAGLVFACTAGLAHTAGICRGRFHINGTEGGSFASGAGTVLGNKLAMKHNSGLSITTSCREDWDPDGFKLLHVLGKTLSFTVDLSNVGCSCTVAVFLAPFPARSVSGKPQRGTCPSMPYYCNAHGSCGQFCPEVDLMQANRHALAATPHKCTAALTPGGRHSHCDPDGCGQNTNSMGVVDYGPGGDFTIDTTRPFQVRTDFFSRSRPEGSAVFAGMLTRLQQGNRTLILDHSPCNKYLSELSEVMASGMSLRVAYWGSTPEVMGWLDNPPCSSTSVCSGGHAGDAFISDVELSDPFSSRGQQSTTLAPTRRALPLEAPWGPIVPFWKHSSAKGHSQSWTLAGQLHTLSTGKIAAASAVASAFFCIVGAAAFCLHFASGKQQRGGPRGSPALPMASPQLGAQGFPTQTYPETHVVGPRHTYAKVLPEREDKSLLSRFLTCCCRAEVPYAPVKPYGAPIASYGQYRTQPITMMRTVHG